MSVWTQPDIPSRGLPGPHLYQKGRTEVAFDPSRRICRTFRPARQVVRLECVDVLELINYLFLFFSNEPEACHSCHSCHSFGFYPDELIN